MREQTPETLTEFYTVIKLGDSKNSYRVDHAPAPPKIFATRMLTRDLFAVANFLLA